MMKSCYNKSAWDLAQDELDAARNVVTSRVEIRKILEQHEASQKSILFSSGTVTIGKPADMYEGLDSNGSPIVMQLEEAGADEKKGKKKGKKAESAAANVISKSDLKPKKKK